MAAERSAASARPASANAISDTPATSSSFTIAPAISTNQSNGAARLGGGSGFEHGIGPALGIEVKIGLPTRRRDRRLEAEAADDLLDIGVDAMGCGQQGDHRDATGVVVQIGAVEAPKHQPA